MVKSYNYYEIDWFMHPLLIRFLIQSNYKVNRDREGMGGFLTRLGKTTKTWTTPARKGRDPRRPGSRLSSIPKSDVSTLEKPEEVGHDRVPMDIRAIQPNHRVSVGLEGVGNSGETARRTDVRLLGVPGDEHIGPFT
jgi:hypothetical protein